MLKKKNFIKFKIYKEYDVTDLPDADGAYYGFWGTSDFERREFELRFYSSNDKDYSKKAMEAASKLQNEMKEYMLEKGLIQ